MIKPITIDFETRSVADLKRWGARRYALDTSTQALCLCWQFPEDPIEGPVHLWHRGHYDPVTDRRWTEKGGDDPDELIRRIRDGEPVEAHNAGFEFDIWNECFTKEFPEFDVKIKLEQLYCSAAKASCLSLPRGLEDAIKALGLPFHKVADGKRLINKLSKPMANRRKKAAGETLKGAFEKEVLANWEAGGKTLTNVEARAMLEELVPFYPQTKNPWASARNSLNDRLVKAGYLYQVEEGEWIYTDLEPPESELRAPAPDDLTKVRFCEEEAEHRRNWEYCKGDVRAERGLSDVCPEMTSREREYWMMDFRMNLRGVALDIPAAKEAFDYAAEEAKRLNGELSDITAGRVQKGSQRAALLKWANGKLIEIGGEPLVNTKADTLSFALDGVPTKAGDEAREAAFDDSRAKWDAFGPQGEYVERALRICMEVNRSSVAKYKRMLQSVCSVDLPGGDDRLHDIMLYNGADRTGRWSGKGVQPHNFVRGYGGGYPKSAPEDEMCDAWNDIMGLDHELITVVWGEPMVMLAKACRGALVASRGKELYAADFNAIEARKLAWLSGCASMLAMFTPGKDIYCDMASGIYGRLITKADKSERSLGKKAILGLGYAMGWEKFQATVWNDEGIWLDDEFCQMVVKVYRKDKYPEVPMLWRDSEKAAISAVLDPGSVHYCGGDAFGVGSVSYFMSDDRKFLHCRLPSGRLLAYLYPQVRQRVTYRFAAINERGRPCTINFPAKKKVPQHQVRWHAEKLAEKQRKRLLADPPESFVSPHLSFMGRDTFTKQWKRCGTHGGSLVENYDQASSRDLLAEAMFRIDEMPEFDLLLSIHDEVIAEAAIGTCKVNEFEDIMSVVPNWAPGMPITAEGWVGPRLRK
jgi:DNA polymerase bacteriophage-type